MAIATLSTLAANYFSGASHIAEDNATGLRQLLNTYIAKINEIIANTVETDTYASVQSLDVGWSDYYGVSDSWLRIDGVNPPLMSKFRLLDTVGGTVRLCEITGGAWVIT